MLSDMTHKNNHRKGLHQSVHKTFKKLIRKISITDLKTTHPEPGGGVCHMTWISDFGIVDVWTMPLGQSSEIFVSASPYNCNTTEESSFLNKKECIRQLSLIEYLGKFTWKSPTSGGVTGEGVLPPKRVEGDEYGGDADNCELLPDSSFRDQSLGSTTRVKPMNFWIV
jgi:hypothetical protein